ncbi:RIP metalloprotease RseP [Candidatus Albibeggiatoa sp. nov. NOAA]|uniref:RIP metalloprotease RseP n=1 Tax=Candidatus Albibeggiatoa sp. nov. NOAA TaxID=3162724 RepID=UPI0032F45501|nr:RIP metalloprotease RseP [Thiotrichaceae bacterium]
MTVLIAIFSFLVAIAILVTVHEFGHYWIAKQLGVKILRFSIGFGEPIYLKRFGEDQTEFVIAPIPLGGYVKMLGEVEDGEEIDPKELPRAFSQQKLWKRAAIVAAGPIFNFILAILLYAAVFMAGEQMVKPVIGAVQPESVAAQAGLQAKDEVIAVNNTETKNWEDVLQKTLKVMLNHESTITYVVKNANGYTSSHTMSSDSLSLDDVAEGKLFEHLGFQPFHRVIPAIVAGFTDDSAGQRDGLEIGDEILAIDGQTVVDWQMWADYVKTHPKKEIETQLQRKAEIITLTLVPDEIEGKGRMGVYAQRQPIPEEYLYIEHYNIFQAIVKGTVKTWDMSTLSLQILWKMLTLEVSAKHISGPITIADYAGKTAQISLVAFISFLALISLSLGVINLLPVPVLDGGHLLMYLIEWIKGSPVTDNMQYVMQQVGFALLLGLMFLAIFNDIGRLFG